MTSDPNKLVYGTHSTENGIIFNDDVAGHLGIVAHYAIIAHDTVMCQMAIGLNKTIAANRCFFPVFCSPVYCNKFPDGCIITYKYIGIFALKFQILRNGCNYCAWKNAAVLSDSCAFHYCNIGTNPGTLSNFHILVNDGKRID